MKERKQVNIRLEKELYEFITMYSSKNYKTVSTVIRDLIVDLYQKNKHPVIMDENNTPIYKKF